MAEGSPPPRERHYQIADRRKLDVGAIQAAAKAAWVEMRVPGSASHSNAQSHGLTPSELPPNLNEVLRIRSAAAGVGSVDVVVAGFLGKVGWDLWRYVVMPYIESRWGVGVIREKLEADKQTAIARGKRAQSKTSGTSAKTVRRKTTTAKRARAKKRTR
jgi:hypothetical protein